MTMLEYSKWGNFKNVINKAKEACKGSDIAEDNYKYAGMLQESEELAKNNKLGIWSDEIKNIQNEESNNQITGDN